MATVKQTSRKITQELGKLERTLLPKLKKFYNQKVKGSSLPISTLQQKYGQEIENLIRKTVEESWLFSNQIIQERTGTNTFTSVKDIQGIEKVTTSMENQFWITAQRLHTRETEFKVNSQSQIQQLSPFDIPAAMVGLSGWFVYYAFNYAEKSKADELGNIKLRFTTRNDCIDTKICLPLEGKLFDIGNVPFQPPLHKHCHCHLIPTSLN